MDSSEDASALLPTQNTKHIPHICTLYLIARTYHVIFTSMYIMLDHVSRHAMITPGNVAYHAQFYTSIIETSLLTMEPLDLCLLPSIPLFGHCQQKRVASRHVCKVCNRRRLLNSVVIRKSAVLRHFKLHGLESPTRSR